MAAARRRRCAVATPRGGSTGVRAAPPACASWHRRCLSLTSRPARLQGRCRAARGRRPTRSGARAACARIAPPPTLRARVAANSWAEATRARARWSSFDGVRAGGRANLPGMVCAGVRPWCAGGWRGGGWKPKRERGATWMSAVGTAALLPPGVQGSGSARPEWGVPGSVPWQEASVTSNETGGSCKVPGGFLAPGRDSRCFTSMKCAVYKRI